MTERTWGQVMTQAVCKLVVCAVAIAFGAQYHDRSFLVGAIFGILFMAALNAVDAVFESARRVREGKADGL